jgi:hypothetical protein
MTHASRRLFESGSERPEPLGAHTCVRQAEYLSTGITTRISFSSRLSLNQSGSMLSTDASRHEDKDAQRLLLTKFPSHANICLRRAPRIAAAVLDFS